MSSVIRGKRNSLETILTEQEFCGILAEIREGQTIPDMEMAFGISVAGETVRSRDGFKVLLKLYEAVAYGLDPLLITFRSLFEVGANLVGQLSWREDL